MFAASTYEEIEQIEKQVENLELVVLLFVKPTNSDALDIVREFEYIHLNSGKYGSIYAIGYSDDVGKVNDPSYRKVDATFNTDWYFSMSAFTEFKQKLEGRIKWEYSGETEILVLQNNPGGRSSLNFSNYAAIDVNKGIREGYIDSFQRFMESLIRISKSKVTATDAMNNLLRSRVGVKDIISDAIGECKNYTFSN